MSQREIAIDFIVSSHLYSQSQGVSPCAPSLYTPSPPLCSHTPLPQSLKSPSSWLTLQHSLTLLFIYLALSLFPCTVSFIYTSGPLFPFLSFLHTISSSHSKFLDVIFCFFSQSLTFSLSNTVGFCRGVGDVWKVTVETNGVCISLASPPHADWFPPALQSYRCIIHSPLALCL